MRKGLLFSSVWITIWALSGQTAWSQQKILNEAIRGVVQISTMMRTYRNLEPYEGQGRGSGFITELDLKKKEAWIVTNHHVVENGVEFMVVFPNRQAFGSSAELVELVGSDPEVDLALLRVDLKSYRGDVQKELKQLPWGKSDAVKIGDEVHAIGFALGFSRAQATSGTISQTQMYIGDATGTLDFLVSSHGRALYLQTTAAINPGNSGGPLINRKGEVIAVNDLGPAKFMAENIAWSIPSNLARRIIERLRKQQPLRCASGLTLQPLLPWRADQLPDAAGVMVACVRPNSAAAKAGVQEKDVIVQVGRMKTAISSETDFPKYVEIWDLLEGRPLPGDTVPVIFYRGSQLDTTAVVARNDPRKVLDVQVCRNLGVVVQDWFASDDPSEVGFQDPLGMFLVDIDLKKYPRSKAPDDGDRGDGLDSPKKRRAPFRVLSGVFLNDEFHEIRSFEDLKPLCDAAVQENNVVLVLRTKASFEYLPMKKKDGNERKGGQK